MTSPLPPDPYKLLGVDKTAGLPEIRSAHRKLVLKCHPDKVQDPALKAIKAEEFQTVQEAYELLSNETKRLQYDEQVKLFELRKEMGRSGPARSSTFGPDIRTAEPRSAERSNTFPMRPSPKETSKSYSHPTRAYEDDLYEEPLRYDRDRKRTAGREEERDRERRKEEERERDRRRSAEEDDRARQRLKKESERASRTEKKKSKEKDRKRDSEEKHRTRATAYVVDGDSDEYRAAPRPEKKSSRKVEDDSPRAEAIHATTNYHIENALKYQMESKRKGEKIHKIDTEFHPAPLRRAETFAAPPSQPYARYTAPPIPNFSPSDDDTPRRSSAHSRTRRSSDTRTRVDTPKTSSKESRRSPITRDPYIVEPPSPTLPTAKKIPPLQKHSSAPPIIEAAYPVAKDPRDKTSRSKTADYPRKEASSPPLPRAATFQSGDRDRGRGGSKLKNQYTSDESDDDLPTLTSPRYHSPRRREAPEPTRYVIDNGRSIPISRHRSELRDIDDEYVRERSESPRGGRSAERPPLIRTSGLGPRPAAAPRSQSQAYYATEPTQPAVVNARPKMAPRESSHRQPARESYLENVKFAPKYDFEHVIYSPQEVRRGSDPSHHRDYYNRGNRREVVA
ncbi:hypothetical protein B7494_g6782 [Chlorociboria aeruginascens]|nr:hypothetical protein B7494_g6782 [Chlorociboria aeruginascens]